MARLRRRSRSAASAQSNTPRRTQSGGWEGIVAAHPGVRDPRSRREGRWSSLTDGIIIAFVALMVMVALLSALNASPVGTVKRWTTWQSQDRSVSVEYPAGWRVIDVPDARLHHAIIMRSEWVRLQIIAGPQLAEATMLPEMGGLDASEADYRSAELLHANGRVLWAEFLGDFDEGAPGRTMLNGVPAVWSQFDYEGGALEQGAMMQGYRATLISGGQGVLLSAVAPKRYWREFEPIAQRSIRSVRVGPKGQS